MKEKMTFETKKAKEYFLEKLSFELGPYELKNLIQNKIQDINIIDVRKYEDYINGHIPFAMHIPIDSFEDNLKMLEKDKVNIFYCYNTYCSLAQKAAYMAANKGYPSQVLNGGYNIWESFDFDIVKTSAEADN